MAADRRKTEERHGKQLGVLRPLVQLAGDILEVASALDPTDADAAVGLSFRQCAEFADAVEILSRQHASAPAGSAARSCIEAGAQTIFLRREPHPVRVAAYHLAPLVAELPVLRKRLTAPTMDGDDLRELGEILRGMEQHLAVLTRAAAYRIAHEQLLRPRNRPTWYSVQGGPENIHRMLDRLGLEVLSLLYADQNSTVHGSPKHALTAMEAAGTWLPPLRSPTGYAFQPILAAVTTLQIATCEVALHFAPRRLKCAQLLRRFAPEHERRATAAGIYLFEPFAGAAAP